jgi:hypothetical protein
VLRTAASSTSQPFVPSTLIGAVLAETPARLSCPRGAGGRSQSYSIPRTGYSRRGRDARVRTALYSPAERRVPHRRSGCISTRSKRPARRGSCSSGVARKASGLPRPTRFISAGRSRLGKLYRRTRKPQTQEHLTTATTMYREMGMTYWLGQAESERKWQRASGTCAPFPRDSQLPHPDFTQE